MKTSLRNGLVLALGLTSSVFAAALPKGQAIYQNDFEGADAGKGWAPAPRFEAGYQSAKAVAFAQTAEAGGGPAVANLPLPVEGMPGCVIRSSAMVKARDVSSKPNPWNGIKFMLMIETPEGTQWPQAPLETGTFDWKRVSFTTRIPTNATAVRLSLGLEKVSGQVWFDNLKITVAKPPMTHLPAPVARPMFKGHDLPRLRGAMIGPHIDAEGLRVLGQEWNANLIRWQLIRHLKPGQQSRLEEFDGWLEGELKRLDAALPYCEQYGLYVLIDLHSPPGGKATVSGYVGSDAGLFADRKAQDKFVEVWQRLARRYLNVPMIWGYDIANEPVEDRVEEDCDDWPALAERTARAIRAIDPRRAIIIEPAQWGGPSGLKDFVPLPVSNIVYSVHMYLPGEFTHQGVHKKGPPVAYPGEIAGKLWDKTRLEAALQPVIDFQQRYNVQIYIGEFSAIRWAPDNSAYRYLRDVIEIFEKYQWDWSYHAFREWQGWSVEHSEDPKDTARTAQPNDRQKLLREWFAKNQKPAWMKRN